MSGALFWFCAGALVGLASAWTLAATVGRLAPGRPPHVALGLAGGAALRWTLAAALLLAALRQGLGAALAAWAGLAAARWAAVLWWHRQAESRSGGRLWRR